MLDSLMKNILSIQIFLRLIILHSYNFYYSKINTMGLEIFHNYSKGVTKKTYFQPINLRHQFPSFVDILIRCSQWTLEWKANVLMHTCLQVASTFHQSSQQR